ncbi:MAG: HDOD domain-containing protein [Spirochaetes bacterium]|nr:HDOD domain-containing protein [Spirochaetota bacterium]MBX3721088.1 HDOD domain-containing protein [Turneriella sp.]
MEEIAIPPLPTIVAQVMQFDANNPKNGAADLEKLVVPDKAISAELLRVANSAFYGRSGKVKVLRDSLAVLGIKATKNLVIYLSTKTMSANYKSDTFKKYLNRFPIYAALVAQNVALETKLKPQADECFLAALLHSIGMNIMALQKQGHYSDMIDACEKNKWELSKLEKQSYGSTHTTLGKRAAEAWKLPEIFKRLMEISPATEYTNLLDPLEKSTYIASVVASTLLEIPYPEAAKANVQRCYTDLGGTQNVLLRHGSPDALAKIQAHPFAQLATT